MIILGSLDTLSNFCINHDRALNDSRHLPRIKGEAFLAEFHQQANVLLSQLPHSPTMSGSKITAEIVKSFNKLVTGRAAVVVNSTGLNSALDRPGNYEHYTKDNTPSRLAAELAYGVIMNHPFQDGNKRTAFISANELLRELNAKPFVNKSPEDIAKDLDKSLASIDQSLNDVASNKIDVEGLAKVFANKLK